MDLLSWLFPRRCMGCKEIGSYICPDCLNQLVPMQQWYCPLCRKPSRWGETHIRCKKQYSLDGLLSCYPYAGLMRLMITKFKYSFVHDLTNTLVELMTGVATYPILFKYRFTLIPVPLHRLRQQWRGFNQAEILARDLAATWRWPIVTTLLRRTRATEPQMKLSGKKRKDNLHGAFGIKTGITLPKYVMLIDDVATTCSTLNECAEILKRAGVKEVWGLTIAQTIPK